MRRGLVFALAGAVLSFACHADEEIDSRFAVGFAHSGRSVSIFGVYKDGQMSSEEWAALEPQIAPAFGGARCMTGYAALSGGSNGALTSAIDDYARANGPTDDLLASLAPAAQGDLVMVLTVAGRPPAPTKTSVADDTGSNPLNGSGATPQSSPRPGSGGASHGHAVDTSVYNVTASLFSVAERRSVGSVAMSYTGPTVNDALARFSTELSHSLPSARCAGWSFEGRLDPERVRGALE
jgi:hypothetical protein